jgi:alpha-L-fucosidase
MFTLLLWSALFGRSDAVATPTPQQLAWSRMEMGCFFHYNIATMGGVQGCSHVPVDISQWNPSALDTDSWMKHAQDMGCEYAVYTAKHGCGFTAWNSKVDLYGYNYSILNSPMPQVDVVGNFVQSAKKYGMKYGFYYSTVSNVYCNVLSQGIVGGADTFKPGMIKVTQEQYNDIVVAHLKELWSMYGELTEVWFDGGYNHDLKEQFTQLFSELQPNVVAFQAEGLTPHVIRWIGNEDGQAPDPTWSAADYGQWGAGNPDSPTWFPAETDFTLQSGDQWFYLPNIPIRSASELRNQYEKSIGRNTNAIIDFAPFPNGTIPEDQQVASHLLGEYVRKCYKSKAVAEVSNVFNATVVVLSIPAGASFDRIVIREDQTNGQNIRSYKVTALTSDGSQFTLSDGTSVGNRKIDALSSPTKDPITKVSLTIEKTVAAPTIVEFSVRSCSGIATALDNQWQAFRYGSGKLTHPAAQH